jgi:hypothetical protein
MSLRGFLFDGIHYLIGAVIVVLLVYSLIQIHSYFSKDNIKIYIPKPSNTNTLLQNLVSPGTRL